ncbi:MAG TPA: sigma-54 dependent transcriptional regulator [Thermoanaerobaculia bacterium]|nr:sigma-54 dependent transcriptional regulator [Thermoanaerobaculia bacterium]
MSQSEWLQLDPQTERFLDSVEEQPIHDGRIRSVSFQRMSGLKLLAHGHHAEAELCLRGALRTARADGDEDAASLIGLDLARGVIYRSPREALGLLKSVRRSGPKGLSQVCLHNVLGTVFVEMCHFELAERNFTRAIEAATGSGDDVFVAYAQANRARNMFELGDPKAARGLNERALGRLEGLGEPASIGLVLCNMAVHCMLQAMYDQAFELLERSRAFQMASNNLRLSAMVDLCGGELELIAGDRDLALERFGAAERTAGLASLPAVQARALIWKAIVERRSGGEGILGDLEAAARDLHGRDLRNDSAMVYLIAACYADCEGQQSVRLAATARTIFGSDDGVRYLEGHYARILSALKERRNRQPAQPFPGFLTQAPSIIAMKSRLHRLVDADVRLLLEGETGTGKTFLARQIHEAGRRRSSPFIVVDCTNLEENLFESKLFGHLRGSFTGAVADAVGLIEQAHTGTLFLDEIGELPFEVQAKLLYTIEEQRYRPVGARTEKRSEFRVIAATNRDIDAMLETGTLRADLFFRLAGYRVHLSPLRERREDIVPLIDHRMVALNGRYGRRKCLRAEVWETLARYDWPGNVRELNTTLERGFHLSLGRSISLDDLGLGISAASLDAADLSWYSVRRTHLLRVLKLCRGNVTRAARLLGINRTTLIYKLKLLDIERSDFDPGERAPRHEGPLRLVADRKEVSEASRREGGTDRDGP